MSGTAWLVVLLVLAFVFRRRLIALAWRLLPLLVFLVLLGLYASGQMQPILDHF